jgi:electron transfer flavoprotein beta subunit
MNILVCLKQTFDTEEKIVLRDGKISEENVEFIINPYDEYAVEEAIKLKEKFGGEVTVISVGPSRAETELRKALAMGADQAVIVDDESLFGDEFTISKVLAAVVKSREFDIILCGNIAVDDGSGQVGLRLAEELGIAHIGTIVKLEVDGDKVKVERDVEGDIEKIEAKLPILLTTQQGLNEPRYPSLPGIMKAKKKPMDRLGAAALGLDAGQIASKTEITEVFLPPKREAGRRIEGEPIEQAKKLVELLRSEAKVV